MHSLALKICLVQSSLWAQGMKLYFTGVFDECIYAFMSRDEKKPMVYLYIYFQNYVYKIIQFYRYYSDIKKITYSSFYEILKMTRILIKK